MRTGFRALALAAVLFGAAGWGEAAHVVISTSATVRVAWDQVDRNDVGSDFRSNSANIASSPIACRERSKDTETERQGCTFVKFDLSALTPGLIDLTGFRATFSIEYSKRVNSTQPLRAVMDVVAAANMWADATGSFPLATWVGPANLGAGITNYNYTLVTNILNAVLPQTISIDVTQDVEDWVNGGVSNNGYVIFGVTDDNQGAGFGIPTITAEVAPADHWTFDETSGSVAVNESAGTNGTISSGVTVAQTGKVGRAYSFDGTANAVVTAVGDKGVAGRGARTVSLWLKTGSSQNAGLVSWGQDASGKAWDFTLSGAAVRLNVNGGNIIGSTAINDGAWHHVVATYPGNDGTPNVADATLYLDGSVEPASSVTSNDLNTVSLLDVAIGSNRSRNQRFSGLIDDVAIWRTALTPGEIRALFELADNAKLNYNASEAQALFDAYAAGPDGKVEATSGYWEYATGLTASVDGQLNAPGPSGALYSLVMDASAGTGLILVPKGTLFAVE